MTDWQRATPSAYGTGKTRRMVERWSSPLGEAVRRMTPVAWPGAPASAILGQTASTSRDTANTTDTSRAQSFHEVGAFQTPAGPRGGPAPNPDPDADHNRWGKLAGSELVVCLLGRPATMVPDGWKVAPSDQVAVGLASLRADLAGIVRKLPKELVPVDVGSEWAVALAFLSFSRGASGAWSRIKPATAAMVAAPERERLAALVRWCALSDDPAAKVAGKAGASRAVLRTLWKLRSGRALEEAVGGATLSWYGAPLDATVEEPLTRRALGV